MISNPVVVVFYGDDEVPILENEICLPPPLQFPLLPSDIKSAASLFLPFSNSKRSATTRRRTCLLICSISAAFLLASILIVVILAFIAFKPRNPVFILFPFGFNSLSLTDLIVSKKDIGENDLKSRRRRVLRRRRGPNIGERYLPPSATPVPPSSF
ncbi:hypothetical protein LINPERHAP2_LOCUS4643 [Linum perenne]